ncbi:redoxin domain-containing protein [Brevibacterium sp. JSBI002]|uniref:redoxin domain-containing protein n=1 Tax=Brevibacterium sp. JSBI002 TaxID=2886045 RepID=UPI00223099E3|nr:redoxin domain-containing protein [Brevibacterium sp. JSBI002]UZD63754.1 redoxin domain-containing protein [Brevibacterium sp. JSBI002]
MILRPGDRAPDLTLPDHLGSVIALNEAAPPAARLLAFVPFAFSPICGDELAALDKWQERMRKGSRAVDVVVVSTDSKYTLAAWARQTGVDVTLASDFWPHGEAARAFGVFDQVHGVAERGVFVISPAGTIVSGRKVARSETRDFSEDVAVALSSL